MVALLPPAALTSGTSAAQIARGLLPVARVALVALLLALFVRAFLLEVVSIPTDSMVPALLPGDQVLVNRFIHTGPRYGVLPRRAVRKGDVVLFRPPFAPRQAYVKRCVGVAGDWFGGGVLPAGALWVEGDARTRSLDSRTFGAIPESALEGRAWLILWSRPAAPVAPAVAGEDSGAAGSAPDPVVSRRRILRQVR